MSGPDPQDESVTAAVVITRRQHNALREMSTQQERSMSYFVRKALDRLLGFEKTTVDPREAEKETAA